MGAGASVLCVGGGGGSPFCMSAQHVRGVVVLVSEGGGV